MIDLTLPGHVHSEPPSSEASPAGPDPGSPSTAFAFNPSDLLTRIWQRSLPLVADRVACLEAFAHTAAAGSLSPEHRLQAADLAHKLAGSLGMFGFPEGTTLSRHIEQHFEAEAPVNGALLLQQVASLRALLDLP